MSYLVFKAKGKTTGDTGIARHTTSALFNFQVFNGTVEFYGSNVPDVTMDDMKKWVKLLTVDENGDPENLPYRQWCWDNLAYKVVSGNDVEIYVASGVAG